MISDILVPSLFFIIALLTITLIILIFKKIKVNRDRLKLLGEAEANSGEYAEKNIRVLMPILENFYGEKKEHYLKNIKKQNQTFYNQLIALLIEYKPNFVKNLNTALEGLNESYANGFYEAAQSCQKDPVYDELGTELKQTISMLAELGQQPMDEKVLSDPYAAQKFLLDCKEKIEGIFTENKSQAEELNQYMDLIEQLRQEKQDMRDTIQEFTKIFERIYAQYQQQLDFTKEASFKKINQDVLVSIFKLTDSEQAKSKKGKK